MRPMNRRTMLASSAGVSLSTLAGARRAEAQNAGPLQIICMVPLSGPFAATGIGRDAHSGAAIAAKHINAKGGVRGRPIEIVLRDSKGDTAEIVAAGREFASQGKNLFLSGMYTAEALAMIPILSEFNALQLVIGGLGMAVTHERYDPHNFRCVANAYQISVGQARLAATRFPTVASWGGLIQDNPAAASVYEVFVKVATKEYDRIGKRPSFRDPVRIKAGALDSRNQAAELTAANIDGLCSVITGQDSVNFYKAANAFGLTKKTKVVVDASNGFGFAKAMGKNEPSNFWVFDNFYHELYKNSPLAQSLYKDYVAETKDPYPQGYIVLGYNAVQAYAQSIAAANGATDTPTLMKILESGQQFDGAAGKLSFRKEDHQILSDLNFLRFGPTDKEPGFEVVEAVKFSGADLVEPAAPGTAFNT